MMHRSRFWSRSTSRLNRQRGYILLTLMLVFAMIAMTQLVVLQNVRHQVQRDREEELCHRGTEYMRAIRRYYRAMGRYPTRIEDLENASGKRFIRKLYKDPMSRDPQTGQEQEFKVLHYQDVVLNSGAGSGQQAGTQAAGWQEALSGNLKPADSPDTDDQQADAAPTDDQQGNAPAKPVPEGEAASKPTPGLANPTTDAKSAHASANSGSGFAGQFEGGAPVVGVASTSKGKTIREFNKKNHYNDWYFIFDPSMNSAGLLVGPWRPLSAPGAAFGRTPAGSAAPSIAGQGGAQPPSGQPQNAPAPQSSEPAPQSP